MRGTLPHLLAACAACPGAALADASGDSADSAQRRAARELPPYLQCVPYARERSGVQIYGDARTWWDQADGPLQARQPPTRRRGDGVSPARQHAPRPCRRGRRVIDSRTVLLDHANWSPIDGRRGQIERGVKAVDVSPANDWSEVRVWYAPLQDLGTTAWPVAGFIYNERDDGAAARAARAVCASASYRAAGVQRPISAKPSKAFATAFASLGEPRASRLPRRREAARRASAQRRCRARAARSDRRRRWRATTADQAFATGGFVAEILEPGFDRAVELERQRLALAVHRLAGLDADPAFGNAVFLDIGAHPVLEPDADAALELVRIEMRAARIDRQAIGRGLAAVSSLMRPRP